MEKEDITINEHFPLFSKPSKKLKPLEKPKPKPSSDHSNVDPQIEKSTDANPSSFTTTFEELGLGDWAVKTFKELGMQKPTAVQAHCIQKILARTGYGGFRTADSTEVGGGPILGFCAGATRELAYRLAEQFRVLGSCLRFRCSVIVGGMDMLTQTKSLISRPHCYFVVLYKADRVLDVGFEEELRGGVSVLAKESTNFTWCFSPCCRQTLLFYATMTSNLDKLLEVSANKEYFYKAYEGFKTVGTLKEQYLLHMLCPKMNDMGLRSAVIFVSTRRICQLLSLLLEELGHEAATLHSMKSRALRLYPSHLFKSGQAPILIVSKRLCSLCGACTARAGRRGLAVCFVSQYDVELIQEIEAVIEKQLESSLMKMRDDGFEETAQDRKKQNMKTRQRKDCPIKGVKRKR
ncbi:hypothetical protein UlMin_007523 [Ulmus minor]